MTGQQGLQAIPEPNVIYRVKSHLSHINIFYCLQCQPKIKCELEGKNPASASSLSASYFTGR